MNVAAKAQAPRRSPTKDDLELNAEGQALLALLDPATRPHELTAKFPRIINRIAQLWRQPAQMDRYFEELLVIDSRGNRSGFPLKILMELAALKEYYHTTTYPTAPSSVWDQT